MCKGHEPSFDSLAKGKENEEVKYTTFCALPMVIQGYYEKKPSSSLMEENIVQKHWKLRLSCDDKKPSDNFASVR